MTVHNMDRNGPHFFDIITNSDGPSVKDFTSLDWNMSNIDPSLVDSFTFQNGQQSQPSMSFQVQQQVQQQHASQQQQEIQHSTMQRFVDERQRQYFTMPIAPRDKFQGVLPHTSIHTSSLPRASHQRMVSPSLSHDLTSLSSSAASPPAEQNYYPGNAYYGADTQFYRQSFPDFQGGPPCQPYAHPQQNGLSCVSMHEIQGFVDPDNGYCDHEEDYGEVAMKNEYSKKLDHLHSQASIHISNESQGYRYPSDEGIGASIKDEGSPKNTILVNDTQMSDIDAEADMDDVDAEHIPATPASDVEYTPKSTRTRKRRPNSPGTKSPTTAKRSRVTKAPQKTKGQVTCKSCSHTPFKDATALQGHIATAHTRAYVCVFDFAGCPSTFASKNEWKRHVSSQHLNLTAWVCEQGTCSGHHSKAGQSISPTNGNANGAITRGSEFNRKDLFTQHLRRMHAPSPVKRKRASTDAAWEERIKDLQQTSLKTKRQAPSRLSCPVCNNLFEGAGCWNDRMEHVGKHLEDQALGKGVVRQGDDGFLVGWALREGIVEKKNNGTGYRLVLSDAGGARRKTRNDVQVDINGDEEDAEGEDE